MEPDYMEFSRYVNLLSCSTVNYLDYNERCDYVQTTKECQERKFFINYIEFLYCTLQPKSTAQEYWGLLFLSFMCVLMFGILAITADRFFCPALEVLSKTMGLSEHMAGVTLLAFGNGSPDLFTNYASIKKPTATLFSNIMSSALYVSGFIGGLICLLAKFRLDGANVLRDLAFFIFGVTYLDFFVQNGTVSLWESVGLVMIYVSYLIIILVDQYLLKKSLQNMEETAATGPMTAPDSRRLTALRLEANIKIKNQKSRASHASLNFDRSNVMPQFVETISVVSSTEWQQASVWKKIFLCLKTPPIFFLTLLLPCVDYNLERHGWSKLLNCLQIVTIPCVMLLISGIHYVYILGCFLVLTPLSIACFVKTRTTEAPPFHVAFAILSALGSMCVIYMGAAEVVEILYVSGLIIDCSSSFLGCTLLAWGNGLGDLIANTTLALHGHPKMAFAASIGGPFFNVIFGIGSVMLIRNFYGDPAMKTLPYGPYGLNCLTFLFIILFGTLIWSITIDFKLRRSVGIFNITVYALFFLYALLGELEVIQTYSDLSAYGTD